jgi:hypothetical protein
LVTEGLSEGGGHLACAAQVHRYSRLETLEAMPRKLETGRAA